MLLQKYVGESRRMVLQQILSQPRVGRKPILQVIIDLTTLEKRGKFKAQGWTRASVSWQARIALGGSVFSCGAVARQSGVFGSIEAKIRPHLLNWD